MPSYLAVLFDASVLYPAPIRDLLVQCAASGLYRGKLTDQINREWETNLLKNRPDLSCQQLERTCQLLQRAMPDCLVFGYEPLIDGLSLPDSDDRHVLAAAIVAKAQVIVTANLKDFPGHILDLFDIEALHPDAFLDREANANITAFLGCVRAIRKRLKNPPLTPAQYLLELEAQGLAKTASFLSAYAALI